jgi:hypothetical protein
MARPTPASLKRVSAENLISLGVEHLAGILVEAANGQPALKRRLRMELAALQGVEHLAVEIDKRLDSHANSKSRVHWRKRSGFVADLDTLLSLIVERLGAMDREGAIERLLRLIDVGRRLNMRMSDRDGTLDAVFQRAAGELGALLQPGEATDRIAESMAANPTGWTAWLQALAETAPPDTIAPVHAALKARPSALSGYALLIRQLANATGDVEAFVQTFSREALRTPAVAAEVAMRLLKAGRVDEAGVFLETAKPKPSAVRGLLRVSPEIDFEWETAWLEYLEASGREAEAQEARWASFERTLSADRVRQFTRRLADFDDVEAEHRAFTYAAAHPDATAGLRFLVDYPALPEAARLVTERADDLEIDADEGEAWAGKLAVRFPVAAELMLRRAAAAAFKRRAFATCDRLTAAADALTSS